MNRFVAEARTLLVRGLELDCLIGVHPHERNRRQRVRIDVELQVRPIRHHDDPDRILSYEDVVAAVRRLAAGGHVRLVETLADRVAACCLDFEDVLGVEVTVIKPDVLPGSAALGVRVRRTP